MKSAFGVLSDRNRLSVSAGEISQTVVSREQIIISLNFSKMTKAASGSMATLNYAVQLVLRPARVSEQPMIEIFEKQSAILLLQWQANAKFVNGPIQIQAIYPLYLIADYTMNLQAFSFWTSSPSIDILLRYCVWVQPSPSFPKKQSFQVSPPIGQLIPRYMGQLDWQSDWTMETFFITSATQAFPSEQVIPSKILSCFLIKQSSRIKACESSPPQSVSIITYLKSFTLKGSFLCLKYI